MGAWGGGNWWYLVKRPISPGPQRYSAHLPTKLKVAGGWAVERTDGLDCGGRERGEKKKRRYEVERSADELRIEGSKVKG